MGMLTNSLARVIRSLKVKKYRSQHGLFMAEGKKIVQEAIDEKEDIRYIVGTNGFLNSLTSTPSQTEVIPVEGKLISELSSLTTNQDGFAIISFDPEKQIDPKIQKWSLYLDGINDPGNMGTLLRTADWFGLNRIYCSVDCCDILNSKAIMASMGSVFRVDAFYSDIDYLLGKNENILILGADLNGSPLGGYGFPAGPGLVVLGNEANGIRESTRNHVKEYLEIEGAGNAESLNVAQSGTIVLYELFRQGRI